MLAAAMVVGLLIPSVGSTDVTSQTLGSARFLACFSGNFCGFGTEQTTKFFLFPIRLTGSVPIGSGEYLGRFFTDATVGHWTEYRKSAWLEPMTISGSDPVTGLSMTGSCSGRVAFTLHGGRASLDCSGTVSDGSSGPFRLFLYLLPNPLSIPPALFSDGPTCICSNLYGVYMASNPLAS